MRFAIVILLLTLAACQQEVTAVRDSSFAAQFGQLNKNGWAVARNDQTPKGRGNSSDSSVRVVREANWSNMQFDTNFHVDDPQIRADLERRRQQQNPQNQSNAPTQSAAPATAPAANPPGAALFGPMPR